MIFQCLIFISSPQQNLYLEYFNDHELLTEQKYQPSEHETFNETENELTDFQQELKNHPKIPVNFAATLAGLCSGGVLCEAAR